MKEEVQNGPLMNQNRRQKGFNLPQISTVFGTVEDVLEQRTESDSNTNKNQDGSRVMTEDEISGMVQDALFKARNATQSLSPHKPRSGTQKPYSSFFPSLENMISTSRSTTLQHAQSLLSGKTTASSVPPTSTESKREQPEETTAANDTTSSEQTAAAGGASYFGGGGVEQTAQGAAMKYVQTMSPTASMMINPSDFVIRKVEDEIANAKKVAQEAFNRVKGVGGGQQTTTNIVDLTDAEDVVTANNEREASQLGASYSTWRSEGPNSTWRSAEDSERQLDSMVSEDYGGGLVYEYSVAPSMSSVGQSNAFCSLDNPIIRVMEHTAAGMNIIDLTNVDDDVQSPPPSSENVQFRAVSPTVLSTDTEEDGVLNTIEKTSESKKSDMKKTPPVKTYPLFPVVKQETIVKPLDDDSQKNDSEKVVDIKTTPIVATKQESRLERLRKLRQPMNIVKEDSHEDSQGTPDDQEQVSLDHGDKVPATDCVGEEMVTKEQEDKDEKIENDEKPEAADEEANAEPVTEQQTEETFFDSIETTDVIVNDSHSVKEEPVTTETVENEASHSDEKFVAAADIEAVAELVTDDQVEDALIDSVETEEDDSNNEKEELGTVETKTESDTAEGQGPLDVASGGDKSLSFEALIDMVETAEVLKESASEKEELDAHEAKTESDTTEGPLDMASGFDKLLSFFHDKEKANAVPAKSKEVNSEDKANEISKDSSVALRSSTQAEPSTGDVTLESVEVQHDGTVSDEMKNLENSETTSEEDHNAAASLEEPTNDTRDAEDTAMEEQATATNPEKASEDAVVASPSAAEAVVTGELGKSGARDNDEIQTVAGSDGDTTGVEEEPANDPEMQHDEGDTNVVEGEPVNDPEIQAVAASEGGTNGVEEEPANDSEHDEGDTNVVEGESANDPETQHDQQEKEGKHPLLAFFDAAREARARDFAALGLGFMTTTEKQTESGVPLPQATEESVEQRQYNAVLTKSGESNEKNSLIEVATTPSVDGQLMPSPVPSHSADNECDAEPETSTQMEDFRYETEQEQYTSEVPTMQCDPLGSTTMQCDPLGSLYRAPVPWKDLEPDATRVSLKNKYDDPPGEYTTRPTEEIINNNRVEGSVPQLSVLDPTDEIQKLQASIMGESVTRRFNACGALKMFAMNKSNQLALARTDGFFDALIIALTTDLVGKDREAAFGTRTRALEILLRTCMPKENRVIIFYHPDLVEAIVSCAIEDSGEIRMAACSVLAMLAKSGHLREPMAQVEALLDVLADSLLGVDSQKVQAAKPLDEVHEHASDEFSSGSDASSDDASSSASETSYESSSDRNQSAKSKKQEMQEKKKETTKQVTTNACAALLHLSKQCAAGHFMCHNTSLLNALLILSQQYEHAMHTRCLEILCNLTRLPANDEILAEHPSVVPVMLRHSTSESEEDRVWALRMLQNISASKAGKHVLVSTFALELLSMSVLRTQAEEQKAAMAALFNLSTDPGCLMAITNTRDVLSSLVLVAQDMNTISDVRMMACDMLATVGLWFQKLAGASTVPTGVKESAIPSNVTTGWNRWD
mmetsp:Transcript_45042/g.108979  ORF Transcript_45042/g.108979 Transcript_45042/m.108979 type:complete len:1551 (+) Transcript_45042:64-4716(+)